MYCRPNQCAESLCNTYIGMHVYSMFVSYLNSFWLDIDRFGIMTSYHRDSCIVWRIYQQRLSYRPTDMPWYCNTKIINPRNYIKKYILTVLRAQVINLTSTHCIMKSVLNNSHSFNMFIQMLFFSRWHRYIQHIRRNRNEGIQECVQGKHGEEKLRNASYT